MTHQREQCENGDCRDHYGDPEAWCLKCRGALPVSPAHTLTRQAWQGIETAPKDGTPFLAWRVEWQEILLCDWHAGNGVFVQVGDDAEREPTHWMPLPDPPLAIQGEERTTREGKAEE